jgi:Xaa-Pro aminopeptidase
MDRFSARRAAVRKLFRTAGADALLVTNFTNVTYLTGFTGDDSYLLVTAKGEVLISDSRYETQLEEECPGLAVEIRATDVGMSKATAKVVKSAKVRTLAIEGGTLTVDGRDGLERELPEIKLHTSSGLVEELRVIKDKQEIEETRLAARYAEKGFAILKATLRPELTEKQVAADLEHQMRLLGAKGCSFPPIVAVGDRAALPHARPTDKKIGEADFVLIDWGATAVHYKSDLTRVLVTGKISPKLERVYGVVLNAQRAAIAAIKPGVTGREVDKVARDIIAKAGFGKNFGHGLGHGVGMDIHEAPRLNAANDQPLRPGMVITVEPGIYLPGWGGVRIEDDILVTKSGHEVLTDVPSDFDQAVL